MSKRKHHEEEDQQPHYENEMEPTAPGGEIQPGCSEPNTVPPSVSGTSQDPKRKKED